MITGDIDDADTLTSLVDDCPQHVVVGDWPIELTLQSPQIEDVAHEVELLAIGAAQEVEQLERATAFETEVYIGNEYRSAAQPPGRRFRTHCGRSPVTHCADARDAA